MDAERFDTIVRAMSAGANRRHLLRALVGTTLAGLLGRPAADAKPKKQKQTKRRQEATKRREKRRQQQRTKRKIGKRPQGVQTQAAKCIPACDPALACCDQVCVDLQTDPSNCGKCGDGCVDPANGIATCAAGECVIACDQGFVDCDGACADTSADPSNCGGCGTRCGNGESCLGGVCQACAPGLTECSRVCTDLTTDPNHCGKCGATCAAPTGGSVACIGGSCVIQCDNGLTDCGGVCAALTTDPANCGSCGIRCGNGEACHGGICQACPTGLAECSGICTDLTSDSNNCGKCGAGCGEGGVCQDGVCLCGDFCGRSVTCGAGEFGSCYSVAGFKKDCVCISPAEPQYGCASDVDCSPDGLCIDYLSTQRGCVAQTLEGGYCRPFCSVGPPEAACPATTCRVTLFCNGTEATRECVVLQTADGVCACLGPFDTADPTPCTTDAECGPGYACQDGNAFWQPCSTACMPRCPTP